MKGLAKVFFWGMAISFLGTLPVGTLNVASLQIGVQESIRNAYWFCMGAVIVEALYVRLSLVAINWIVKRKNLMKYMEWATFFIIAALAVGSFIAAFKSEGGEKNIFLQNDIHRFLLGMIMNALNPVQIPFWFGWSTVMITKKTLKPTTAYYNWYVIGIALGTIAGRTLYILGGSLLVRKLESAQDYLNLVIAIIFSITACIQLWRILSKKGIAHKMDALKNTGI